MRTWTPRVSRRRHGYTFAGNCSCVTTMFWPAAAGRFLAAMASPYDAAGMIAIRVGSGALTSRANSVRARIDSEKKSDWLSRDGTRFRAMPVMPADSTATDSGDM